MDIEVKVPDIGSEEVEVTEVLVEIGENVSIEQPLLTVEGNKTSMEIPSPYEGAVGGIFISVGDVVKSGSLIMMFKGDDIDLDHSDGYVKLEPGRPKNSERHSLR